MTEERLRLNNLELYASRQPEIDALNAKVEMLNVRNSMIVATSEALIYRWDTPLWKDAPATAIFINELRNSVSATEPEATKWLNEQKAQVLEEAAKLNPENGFEAAALKHGGVARFLQVKAKELRCEG